MRNTIFLTGVLAVLALAGCASEKSFDVTGIVPPSEMRDKSAPVARIEPVVVKAPRRDALPEPAPRVERKVSKPAAEKAAVTFPDPDKMTSKPAKVTLVPDTGLVGKVASANASLHFVVLNFPVGRMAAVEQSLVLYRQGQKIGEVKVTGPQQDDNIIADVVSGEAEAGDEVREK